MTRREGIRKNDRGIVYQRTSTRPELLLLLPFVFTDDERDKLGMVESRGRRAIEGGHSPLNSLPSTPIRTRSTDRFP